ncbi:MAG: ATP-dependent sacrificial sulfur transferase LarE [Thermoplasmata archaeon]
MVDRSADAVPTQRTGEVVHRMAQGGGPIVVAMSGGVDSSVVAALAFEAVGDQAIAVTLTGPAVARREVERAARVARTIGIEHRPIEVDPLALASYRENPSNRCFFCRSIEAEALTTEGAKRGARQYVDGIHLDDLREERPGIAAMERAGFRHPLASAGWRKVDVRREAQRRALPNWDEPSDACLASRIAHGEPIDRELLSRIERAEELVRALGFRQVRVRVRDGAARIEVEPEGVGRLSVPSVTFPLTEQLIRLGFAHVTIDPAGYHGTRPPVGAQ